MKVIALIYIFIDIFIFEMSNNEGSIRKSKRQPVPNPIYSQGINELKKVPNKVIDRSRPANPKEKGKLMNYSLLAMRKNNQVLTNSTTQKINQTKDGYHVFWRMGANSKFRLFHLSVRLKMNPKNKLKPLRNLNLDCWAFFRK